MLLWWWCEILSSFFIWYVTHLLLLWSFLLCSSMRTGAHWHRIYKKFQHIHNHIPIVCLNFFFHLPLSRSFSIYYTSVFHVNIHWTYIFNSDQKKKTEIIIFKVKYFMIQYLIDNLCIDHSLISNEQRENAQTKREEDTRPKSLNQLWIRCNVTHIVYALTHIQEGLYFLQTITKWDIV